MIFPQNIHGSLIFIVTFEKLHATVVLVVYLFFILKFLGFIFISGILKLHNDEPDFGSFFFITVLQRSF